MSDNYNDLFNDEPVGNDEPIKGDTPDTAYNDNAYTANTDSANTAVSHNEYHYKGTGEKENLYSGDSYSTDYVKKPHSEQGEHYSSYANTGYTSQPDTYANNNTAYSNSAYTSPYQQPYTQPASQYGSQYGAQYNPQYSTNPYSAPPVKPKKEKKPAGKGFVACMLIVCMLLSSALGFTGALVYTKLKAKNAEISTNGAMIVNKVDIDEQTAQQLADKPTSQITQEVADTVVEITTEVMSTNSFYGQYISQGAGSGVIISSDGYIVTNNHVIEGASSITVTLRDKTSYEARLVGTDSIVDVALLKIEATGLKAATFGDSDNLKVGDKAVAIGNPLGQLGGTVTDGIISALDRDVVIDGETMNLLQTDTAINPGNSGGGLFDGQGALIGVVVAKSSGEEIEGLGFAIPINDVIDILDDLKEYGYVRGRVSVGMELIDLTNPMYAMYYYGNDEAGCYVYSVEFDSAAYKAGVNQGDRIVSVDSKQISSSADVEKALEGKKVGDVIKVELERGTKTATIDVTLGEYVPDDVIRSQQNQNDDVVNPFA